MLPARLALVADQPVSDEHLMLSYRDGNAVAFDELYGRHRGGVFRYVLRQVGLRSAAEEVFQEIWMNIISSRARYRVEARFTTFLYHVAHNCVVDCFRRKTPLHLISLDDDADEAHQVPGPDRDQPERIAEAAQNLQTTAGDFQLPLHRLIAIGDSRHPDPPELVRRLGEGILKQPRGIVFHDDLRFKVQPGGKSQILV